MNDLYKRWDLMVTNVEQIKSTQLSSVEDEIKKIVNSNPKGVASMNACIRMSDLRKQKSEIWDKIIDLQNTAIRQIGTTLGEIETDVIPFFKRAIKVLNPNFEGDFYLVESYASGINMNKFVYFKPSSGDDPISLTTEYILNPLALEKLIAKLTSNMNNFEELENYRTNKTK